MIRRGELQKYVKGKTLIKPASPQTWGDQGKKNVGQARTSKDGEGLNVVSFVQLREDEKLGRYEKFEERRLKRGLKTISVKGYVNTISGGQFQ